MATTNTGGIAQPSGAQAPTILVLALREVGARPVVVNISPSALVAQLTELVRDKLRYDVSPDFVELKMADGGYVLDPFATLAGAGVEDGTRVIATVVAPPQPATTAAAGNEAVLAAVESLRTTVSADVASLGADVASLGTKVEKLTLQSGEVSVEMSKASTKLASAAVTAFDLSVGGRLGLPDLTTFMPKTSPTPFAWGTMSEFTATPRLYQLLKDWVTTHAVPPVNNLFIDTRSFSSSAPIQFHIPGTATFKGVPDLMIARHRIGRPEAAIPLTLATAVSIDWKTPTALNKVSKISSIGTIHALAMSEPSRFEHGVPVFFTDMATGFWCWLVVDRTIWYLHHDDGRLTLAEGVGLIRYFLHQGTLGLVPAEHEGRLVFVSATHRASAASVATTAAPPAAEAAELPSTSHTPSGGKGSMQPRTHAPIGLVSRDVSPESAEHGSDNDADDMDTVVIKHATALMRGGGFPTVTWRME